MCLYPIYLTLLYVAPLYLSPLYPTALYLTLLYRILLYLRPFPVPDVLPIFVQASSKYLFDIEVLISNKYQSCCFFITF